MSKHTPGPVESLARLAIQSDRYRTDEEFRDAVDAVLGQPIYDAAPEILEALVSVQALFAYRGEDHTGFADYLIPRVNAAIAKAEGRS